MPLLSLDRLAPLSLASVARQRPTTPQLSEEERESLLKRIGQKAIGAVSGLGNVLDVPSSVIRDIAGLATTGDFDKYNPFDQLQPWEWTKSGTRVSGRELGRDLGWIGPTDTAANWWGGLGLEVGLDPLTYLGFGALTKAGQVAGKAGTAVKGLSAGMRAGEKALLGAYLPLATKPFATFGTGRTAQKIAGGLEDIGHGLRYSKLGRVLGGVFSARAGGRTTESGQKYFDTLFEKQTKSIAGVRQFELESALKLQRAGKTAAQYGDEMRMMAERVAGMDPSMDPSGVVTDMVKNAADELDLLERYGLPLGKKLQDKIQYLTRFGTDITPRLRGKRGPAGPFAAHAQEAVWRKPQWKGYSRGTIGVNELVTDPVIRQIRNDPLLRPKDKRDLLTAYIKGRYGPTLIDPQYARYKGGKQLLDPITGQPVMGDRYNLIAKSLMRLPEHVLEKGLFRNHPVYDVSRLMYVNRLRINSADTLFDFIVDTRSSAIGPDRMRIGGKGGLLFQAGLRSPLAITGTTRTGALGELSQRMGGVSTKDLARMTVPRDVAEDLLAVWPKFDAPKDVKTLSMLFDSMTNMFKIGVLTHPARYTRDLTSGQVQNMLVGIQNPYNSFEAWRVLTGGNLASAKELPAVKARLAAMGVANPTDKQATDTLRSIFQTHYTSGHAWQEMSGAAPPSLPTPQPIGATVESLLKTLPGAGREGTASLVGEIGGAFVGRRPNASWNPLRLRGVLRQKESRFPFAVAGEITGEFTDHMNRMAPLINLLRKEWDPAEAMKAIDRVQVSYDPRTFTPSEAMLKRVFPFYAFLSRQFKFLGGHLTRRPGGRMGQLIRAQSRGGSEETILPQHVQQTLSIPFGTGRRGDPRYIAGFGLMHEDPSQLYGPLLAGNWPELLREMGGRTSPYFKAPAEAALGRTFFQRGPGGGRDIEDLDPTMARTLANINEYLTGTPSPYKVKPLLGSQQLEMLAMNSPLARLISSGRILSDPRKAEWEKAVNLLSGVRTPLVSEAAQDAAIKELLDESIKQMGGREFVRTYVPQYTKAQMGPEQRALADLYGSLQHELESRAKARSEKRKTAKVQ